ncbi:MurR/RpiR family transcriptional regulator [Atopobacter sp. AH10]|uniref:MurR/RpiR family transcriptional regulator n=1 Tax=Atopobacter sp. AH10 TaxID=2315861 RepID=UPI000EF1B527|nr:MurR/RpiR family transcriptional regulator [Atopobacter sp. AH10]RLK63665.1 MurR/RpiR family transcriptional regulator [Atopobacter sp. AH10]
MSKDTLTSTERYAWNYIQDHQQEIPHLSITQLSEKANTSTASIIRALRKKGYSGYTPFKQQLIQKEQHSDLHQHFSEIDGEIRQAILKNELEVVNTLKSLDPLLIEEAVQLIQQSQFIYIFARGFSEMVGQEMQLKLTLAYKNCTLFTDPNIIKIIADRLTPKDLLINLSLNGETEELIQGSQVARIHNVPILTLTTNPDSRLARLSDVLFVGYKSQTSFIPDFEVRSRLPLHIMSRILLDAYIIRQAPKAKSFYP